MGLAFEVTEGTYVAPTKFFPIRSETLQYQQATNWRRVIRQIVEVIGSVPGYSHVEGDIEIEALPDVVPYFLHAARTNFVKTGTSPYTYTYTGSSAVSGTSGRSLSLTIVRDGIAFGYTGIRVSHFEFGLSGETATVKFHVLGRDEAEQSLPTPSYANQGPFGAGQYDIEIPTATSVFDTDTFTFTVEDNGTLQYRLKNTGRTPQFVKYGERTVNMKLSRDFVDATDYNAFKALTSQSITLKMIQSTSAEIDLFMPVATKNTYEIQGLRAEADLIRANIDYQGVYDPSTTAAYKVTVLTTENIT
jgi:hypothetical protein